jgi:hypothetical protein
MKKTVLTAFALIAFTAPAKAGFEWMPPSQNPAPTPSNTQQYETMSPTENDMGYYSGTTNSGVPSNRMPAAPTGRVVSEPLDALAPTPIMPEQQMSRKASGKLYINPYPLQDSYKYGEPMAVEGNSVEKAMVEESRMLNPLPLGAGMKTGAQPRKEQVAAVEPMNAYQQQPMGMDSMTPMMGNEPAPLPGTGMQSRGGPMQATPIGGFSEAVGFGRDLPLALALSQVVPSDFTHSYGANVDPGVTVSWEGGKPWNQVLNEMLAPQGMQAVIRGNQVIIQSAYSS